MSILSQGCQGYEPIKSQMEFSVKPSFTMNTDIFSNYAPRLYYKKDDPNTILIVNYGGEGAWKVDLPSGRVIKTHLYDTPFSAELDSALKEYQSAEDASDLGEIYRDQPQNPNPWHIEYRGIWKKRYEWWTKGSSSFIGPPTGIQGVHTAYFSGDILVSVQGNPILKQHVDNFNRSYYFKFQEALEQGILFFVDERTTTKQGITRPMQTWTIIRVPSMSDWRMPPDWARFTGEFKSTALRTSDGKLIGIQAEIGVELKKAGNYVINAPLSGNVRLISSSVANEMGESYSLHAGHNMVRMIFSGYRINEKITDGPYFLKYLSIEHGRDIIYHEEDLPIPGFSLAQFHDLPPRGPETEHLLGYPPWPDE